MTNSEFEARLAQKEREDDAWLAAAEALIVATPPRFVRTLAVVKLAVATYDQEAGEEAVHIASAP